MELTVIRYDDNLTKIARKIFGDIIDSAYITTWDITSEKEEILSRLEAGAYKKQTDNEIDYNDEIIWIKFTNNNTVAFSNSEWGSIYPADIDNSYIA